MQLRKLVDIECRWPYILFSGVDEDTAEDDTWPVECVFCDEDGKISLLWTEEIGWFNWRPYDNRIRRNVNHAFGKAIKNNWKTFHIIHMVKDLQFLRKTVFVEIN